MGKFIKSKEHFANYIMEVANGLPHLKNPLSIDQYIGLLSKGSRMNTFAWGLKGDPYLLEEENFLGWLKRYDYPPDFKYMKERVTAEFIAKIELIINGIGVYSFWSEHDSPLYIGFSSYNIGTRATSSFLKTYSEYNKEKTKDHKPMFFKYILYDSASDAAVVEVYLIGKLKPTLNKASNYKDKLSVMINPEPAFSDPILCNRPISDLI